MPSLLVHPIGVHGRGTTHLVCVARSPGASSPRAGRVRTEVRLRGLYSLELPLCESKHVPAHVDGACGHTTART